MTGHNHHNETRRLAGFGGGVLLLHVLGWGLFLLCAPHHPALAGLGVLAYVLGLRHAFDADHIAAIDNTTRKLLQDGGRPLGVGFFFSLGHATIVFALTVGLALAVHTFSPAVPALQSAGGIIGTSVSGAFLLAIGFLNLVVLADLVRVSREMRRGRYDEVALERRLLDRGMMSRIVPARLADRIDASWKLYPLGLLFGLGFDTATEIGLLVLATGAAGGAVPFLAVISLPLIFAAGMSLVDTADGVFMCRAYGWALAHPVRRVYFNLTVTTLSVAVALLIGVIELVQVLTGRLAALDLGQLGYVVVALFVVTWAAALLIWRVRNIEERWGAALASGGEDLR